MVAIGRQPDATTPYVDLHSYATAQLLLSHLSEQGARRIALLIGSERRNSYVETEQAYREFARDHRFPIRIARATESGGESAGYAEASGLLAQDPAIDAICAPVDAFAVGAVRAVTELGRHVTDDVRVVTRYDGLRARNCKPPLTAVDLHLDRVASLAVDLLFEHLAGDSPQSYVAGPEPTLVPRESSMTSPHAILDNRAA